MTKSLLLVEDDEDLLESTQTLLENTGFDVSIAKNGDEAIQKYKSYSPCLVFMDLMMPKKDGYEAFNEIKQNDPSAKVIFVSGCIHDEEKLNHAQEIGLLSFLHKPVSLHDYQEMFTKFD